MRPMCPLKGCSGRGRTSCARAGSAKVTVSVTPAVASRAIPLIMLGSLRTLLCRGLAPSRGCPRVADSNGPSYSARPHVCGGPRQSAMLNSAQQIATSSDVAGGARLSCRPDQSVCKPAGRPGFSFALALAYRHRINVRGSLSGVSLKMAGEFADLFLVREGVVLREPSARVGLPSIATPGVRAFGERRPVAEDRARAPLADGGTAGLVSEIDLRSFQLGCPDRAEGLPANFG